MGEERVPKPGSFGLSRIGGVIGFLVWLGQLLAGDGSRWTHAFVVLDSGELLEAEPGGARIRKLADRYSHREVVFCDKPVKDGVRAWQDAQLSAGQVITYLESQQYEESLRARIVATTREDRDVQYGWLNYLFIGLKRFGFTDKWLRRRIEDQHVVICSQEVDAVFQRVGVELFDDKRWSGEVTPGDLAHYANGDFVYIK